MACSLPGGNLGRIQQATNPNSSYACMDSGCTQDMCPTWQSFLTYTPLSDCYVTIANSEKITCAGRGAVILTLRDKTVKLANVLHVSDLEMTLLSVRSHRGRDQGCSFIADASGCFLTFPSFVLDIDDSDSCVVPCSLASLCALPDYSETAHRHASRASHSNAFRFSAKRARGTLLHFVKGAVQRVGVPPKSHHDLKRRVAPPIRPYCEVPESSTAAIKRYTPQQLHRLLGSRTLSDYKQLQTLGTGIQVVDTGDPPLSLGSVVNIQQSRKGHQLLRPKQALATVGLDICYGDGISPGGFSYCLLLVDRATRKTWVYGLKDMNGATLADALWKFFIDTGGSPNRRAGVLATYVSLPNGAGSIPAAA